MNIHPTALIDADARLAADVDVGAYSIIGAGVEIGAGTRIGAHVVIQGPTRIGDNNRIWPFASIGADAQDKKFTGEHAELVIGNDNVFREFTTIHRGTGNGGGVTRIGNDNWFLAYVHIAHDCQVGNHNVFSNNATLAGHVEIGDYVNMSGFAGAAQFCRIGAHAFAAMYSAINGDVPPYCYVAGQFAEPRGVNIEGLKRRGFDSTRIAAIKRAYRALYMSGLGLQDALARLREMAQDSDDVAYMLGFIEGSQRPLVR